MSTAVQAGTVREGTTAHDVHVHSRVEENDTPQSAHPASISQAGHIAPGAASVVAHHHHHHHHHHNIYVYVSIPAFAFKLWLVAATSCAWCLHDFAECTMHNTQGHVELGSVHTGTRRFDAGSIRLHHTCWYLYIAIRQGSGLVVSLSPSRPGKLCLLPLDSLRCHQLSGRLVTRSGCAASEYLC